MKQYAFRIEKDGRRDTVHCTAPDCCGAWLQVLVKYGAEFNILASPVEVLPPHHYHAEIDAADMTEEDATAIAPQVLPYLQRMIGGPL